MRTSVRIAAAFAVALLSASCTIRHEVQKDYPQYLQNNTGASNLPKTNKAKLYYLTPSAQKYSYEFRAFLTGAANLWVVEIGKMLADTLDSNDAQVAFGKLVKSADGTGDQLLTFDIQEYTFKEFGAHITLKVTLTRGGKVVFDNTYTQDGKGQGGKMAFAGVFGQKNAVQQSTKLALDEILRRLIADLNLKA